MAVNFALIFNGHLLDSDLYRTLLGIKWFILLTAFDNLYLLHLQPTNADPN